MRLHTYAEQFGYEEVLTLDESGGVFKVAIRPYKRDTFTLVQLEDLAAMLGAKVGHASYLKLWARATGSKPSKRYDLKYAQDWWISSASPGHLELVFLVHGDPFNSTYIDQESFVPLEFGLFTSAHPLDVRKNISGERQLFLYDHGLVACSAPGESYVYNPTVCDLSRELRVNDTLVFEARGHLFASRIERFVTPFLLQLSDRSHSSQLQLKNGTHYNVTRLTTADSAPEVHFRQKAARLSFKDVGWIPVDTFFGLDSRNGSVEWRLGFESQKSKPRLMIDDDLGRFQVAAEEPVNHLLKKGDLLVFPILLNEYRGEASNASTRYEHPVFEVQQFKMREGGIGSAISVLPDSAEATKRAELLDFFAMTDFTADFLVGVPIQPNKTVEPLSRLFESPFKEHIFNLSELAERAAAVAEPEAQVHSLRPNAVMKLEVVKAMMLEAAKFQFSVQQAHAESEDAFLFEFTFNQDFGVHIGTGRGEKPFYLDLNLFNSQKRVALYLSFIGDQVAVSVQGLTFNDIIYTQSAAGITGDLQVKVAAAYQKAITVVEATAFDLSSDEAALKYAQANLETYDYLRKLSEDMGPKMVYMEEYDSGSTCYVTQKPRRIRLFYYCDEYAGH